MNLDSLSFALSQINYLITNLNKKNFKTSQIEILQVKFLKKDILYKKFNIYLIIHYFKSLLKITDLRPNDICIDV